MNISFKNQSFTYRFSALMKIIVHLLLFIYLLKPISQHYYKISLKQPIVHFE